MALLAAARLDAAHALLLRAALHLQRRPWVALFASVDARVLGLVVEPGTWSEADVRALELAVQQDDRDTEIYLFEERLDAALARVRADTGALGFAVLLASGT